MYQVSADLSASGNALEDDLTGVVRNLKHLLKISVPSSSLLMGRGLEDWLDWHSMERLDDARGRLSLKTTRDPGSFERAHYIRTLHSWPPPRPSP